MYYLTKLYSIINLQSSFIIVTITEWGLILITPLGNDLESIYSPNDSFGSKILSSAIKILIEALVSPAANVTLYVPM